MVPTGVANDFATHFGNDKSICSAACFCGDFIGFIRLPTGFAERLAEKIFRYAPQAHRPGRRAGDARNSLDLALGGIADLHLSRPKVFDFFDNLFDRQGAALEQQAAESFFNCDGRREWASVAGECAASSGVLRSASCAFTK
jgi:hypothetical protein